MNWVSRLFIFGLLYVPYTDSQNNAGSTFFQTFNYNHPDVEAHVIHAFVLSTEASECTIEVTVDTPPLTKSTVQVNNTQAVLYTVNAASTRGIKLNGTCQFVAYGLNFAPESADGWLAIPVQSLSTEYSILGVPPWLKTQPTQLTIVAAFDNTTCVSTFPNGSQHISQLNEIGVDYITSTFDMTGTEISCNEKVTVLTGQRCSFFPEGCGQCDHTIEQVPPKSTLGRNFCMVPLLHSCKSTPSCCTNSTFCAKCTEIYRIMAIENETLVMRNGTESNESFTLQAGQSRYILLSQTEISYLVSTRPVLLGHLFNGQYYENDYQDPSFAIIPQIESYSKHYRAATCFPQFQKHFFNLVLPKNTSDQLLMNGKPFLNPSAARAIPGTNFEAFQYQCDCSNANGQPTSFTIEHPQNEKFGMFAYGFTPFISYGYPGGMNLQKDLYFKCAPSQLNLTGPSERYSEACNLTEATGQFDANVSYWTDEQCCPGNTSLTYIDTILNSSSCTKIVQRTWALMDGCQRTVSVNQTEYIEQQLDLYDDPPNEYAEERCHLMYGSNSTGTPQLIRNCGTTKQISFNDTTDNATYVNRTWTIEQKCTHERIQFNQTINCGPNATTPVFPTTTTSTILPTGPLLANSPISTDPPANKSGPCRCPCKCKCKCRHHSHHGHSCGHSSSSSSSEE